jgi:hypothetical protein
MIKRGCFALFILISTHHGLCAPPQLPPGLMATFQSKNYGGFAGGAVAALYVQPIRRHRRLRRLGDTATISKPGAAIAG